MSKVDDITTEFAEYICDNLCKYPCEIKDVEALENICCECKLGRYICDICNASNKAFNDGVDKVIEEEKNLIYEDMSITLDRLFELNKKIKGE